MASGVTLYVRGIRNDSTREEWALYWRMYRKRYTPDMKHGFRSTYVNHSCRCSECKAANRAYKVEHKLFQEAGVTKAEVDAWMR